MSRLTASLAEFGALFPRSDQIVVAYSGGRDSHTLLALAVAHFAGSKVRVSAMHINHGLHPDSHAWSRHCATVCAALGIELHTDHVSVDRDSGDGLEAAARRARYAAFERRMTSECVLLQGHHADDQAETVLLRLLRGSGIFGAAGMPSTRALGAGSLWRPFLSVPVDTIASAAQSLKLNWVDDPSNADTRFDRNYLRHRVMPALHERWPQAAESLAGAASHIAEASALIDTQFDALLPPLDDANTLDCGLLRGLDRPQAVMLLHRWCCRRLATVPRRSVLETVIDEVVNARSDAQPSVRLGDRVLHRHLDRLHAVTPKPELDSDAALLWPAPRAALSLPDGDVLTVDQLLSAGLDARHQSADWVVRWRRGGEHIKVAGRPRTALKKALHAAKIPPWERTHVPLLYIDGELAWARGIGLDVRFSRAD